MKGWIVKWCRYADFIFSLCHLLYVILLSKKSIFSTVLSKKVPQKVHHL